MTNGIIENPFDLNTKPWDEFNELIETIGPNVAKCNGNEGKILKVRSDGKGTYWSASGGGGTTDYEELSNRPKIAGTLLSGDKSLVQLGILKNFFGTTEAGKVLKIGTDGYVTAETGGSGTVNYNDLTNKPKINSIELIGDVSLGDIGAFKKDWGTTYNGKVIKIVDGIATPVDGTSSAVAFADITGAPSDNTALATVLNDKLGKSGHTTSAGKIVKVGTTGELEFATNVADEVAYANITGNVTDNTALANALNGKVPLSVTSSPIAGFGIDANGDVYVDIP